MFQRVFSGPLFSFVFSTSLTLLAISAPSAQAADKTPPPGRDGKHIEKFIAKLEKELELTASQRTQVRAILRPTGEKAGKAVDSSLVQPPEAFAKEGRRSPLFAGDFVAQLRADKVDTVALNRTFAERQAKMKMYHDQQVAKFVQLHAVLTPAQRLKLADMLEKRLSK
jgi:Spy/CpxP family protein refolding chaperone